MSLSTLLPQCVVADIARRRDCGMLATPEMFGSYQNPLGANRLPQVLTFVASASSPKRPFVGPGEVMLSVAFAISRTILFFLTETWAHS
jgi:hypothetical protein